MGKFVLAITFLCLGITLGGYISFQVLGHPPKYVQQCEQYAFGVMEAEKIISKITAEAQLMINQDRENVRKYLEGKKVKLATSSVWIPDWAYDGERWLHQRDEMTRAYLP